MSSFGPCLGPWNIEKAVLETLKEWMPAWLRNIEETNELQPRSLGRPPSAASYRGGLDWMSVKEEWLPAVIAVANPVGKPERNAEIYTQAYQVDVGCVVLSEEGTDPEGAARMRAGFFAAATMALASHGGLGDFAAQETVLVGAPQVEFFDEDQRKVAVGVTKWHVYAEILDPNKGPVNVKEVDPEGPYPDDPVAESHDAVVKAEPVQIPL
jgi:hypothetical protein